MSEIRELIKTIASGIITEEVFLLGKVFYLRIFFQKEVAVPDDVGSQGAPEIPFLVYQGLFGGLIDHLKKITSELENMTEEEKHFLVKTIELAQKDNENSNTEKGEEDDDGDGGSGSGELT